MLTYPFPFAAFTHIQNYVIDAMQNFNKDKFYLKSIFVPQELENTINTELHSYNLPELSNFLVFKRKNFYEPVQSHVHIDYSVVLDEFVNCSVVFPIEGCCETYMYWMDGEYITEKVLLPDNISGQMIKWKTTPRVIYSEFITEPTLCKVNVPHDACSRYDGSYRVTATMRLKGNPTLEEVVNLRFGSCAV